jgi:hypothetical protein
MRNRLEQRLAELRSELMAGLKMSNELDAKRAGLQATMLRIAGAIDVIEEVLAVQPAAWLATTVSPPSRLGNGAELAPG